MFTIEDIANAEFEKGVRGYKPQAVHDFLAQLAAQIEQLTKEKEDLEKKLYILAGKVEEYRGEEDMLKTAMINAQRMGENVIREARQKADSIVREADLQANLIDEKTKEKLRAEDEKFVELQQKVTSFKAEVLAIYKNHIESLSELPVFDVEETEQEIIQNEPVQEAEIPEYEPEKYVTENNDDENIFAKTISETQPEFEPEFNAELEPQIEIEQEIDKEDTIDRAAEAIKQNSDIFGSIFGFADEEPEDEDEYEEVDELKHEAEKATDNNDDTSDLDSLFGLNGVKYKPVSLDSEQNEENDDTTIYEKADEPAFFAKPEPQQHEEVFKNFFEEENEEEFEKPPLKSSVFEKFNGVNFND